MAGRFKALQTGEIEIAERLRLLRLKSRFSQEHEAIAIGVTRDQLANVENLRVPLKFWPGWRACCFFGVNPSWLYSGEGRESPWDDEFWAIQFLDFPIGERTLFSAVMKHVAGVRPSKKSSVGIPADALEDFLANATDEKKGEPTRQMANRGDFIGRPEGSGTRKPEHVADLFRSDLESELSRTPPEYRTALMFSLRSTLVRFSSWRRGRGENLNE